MPHAATLLERGTLPPSLSGAIMGVAHCTGDAWIMAAPTTRDSEGLSRGPAGSVIGGLESILFPRLRRDPAAPPPNSLLAPPASPACIQSTTWTPPPNTCTASSAACSARSRHPSRYRGTSSGGSSSASMSRGSSGKRRLYQRCFPAHGRRWLRPNDSPSTTGNATAAR